MANTDIAFSASVDLGEGAKSLRSLKQEFKDTQKELDGLSIGSEKYVKTLQKLGKVKDEIGDLNDEINAFKPEGKVQAFGNVLGGVASGFQAATGAAALFGGENKDLEKTLVKLQAVMAFTEGIKGLTSLGDGFKVLGNVIKSNPLFLIATIVLGIGTALYALKDKIGVVGDAFKFLGEIIGEVVQVGKDFLDFLGLTSFASDEKADKIIKNAQREAVALESRYDREIARAKAAGLETTELEKQKQLAIIKTLQVEAMAIVASAKARGKFTEEENKRFTELIAETQKASDAIVLINITETKKKEDQHEKNVEKYKATLDKEKAEHQKYLDAKADAENAEADAYDARKKKQSEDARKAEIDSYNQSRADAEIVLADYNKDLVATAELKALYTQQDTDSRIALLELKKQQELENTELTESERALIVAKYAEQEKQLHIKDTQEKLQIAQQSAQALQGLSDLYFTLKSKNLKKGSKEELENAKKQFKINKGLSIASTLISGLQGVVNGLTAPYPQNIILPILAGITTTASVAKIASTQFNDGGAGASGASLPSTGTPSIPNAPTVNAPSSSVTHLNPDGTVNSNNGSQQSQQVYVVENDITSTQQRVNVIEGSALIH